MIKRTICVLIATMIVFLQSAMLALAANDSSKAFDYAIAYSSASDIGIEKTASAVSAMEVETQRVVVDTNSSQQFKAQGKNVLLMVAYIAATSYRGDTVKIEKRMIVDEKNNVLGLKDGMKVSFYDLLAAVIYLDDVNAASALALAVGNTESGFISGMNNVALRLGMKNTHYTNFTGKYDDAQKTTVEDMMILSYYCYLRSNLADIFSSRTHFVKTPEIAEKRKTIENSFEFIDTDSERYNSNVYGIGINVEKDGSATSLIVYITSKQKFIFAIRSKKNSCSDDVKNTLEFLTKNYALTDISKIIFEIGEKVNLKIGGEDVYFTVLKNTVSQANVVVNLYYSKSVATKAENYTVEPPDDLPASVEVGDTIRGFKILYSGKLVSTVSLAVKSIGELEEETTSLNYTIYEKGTYVEPKQSFLKKHSWLFIVGAVAVAGIAVVIVVEKLK